MILTSTKFRQLLIATFLLMIGGIYVACAQTQIGDFDWEKYHALKPEKRQKYDLLFFNEMETWNMNSARYGLDGFGKKREQDFRRMAADGYLPAYVSLRIFVFDGGNVNRDEKAYDMLLRASEKGTDSERCALFPILWWAKVGVRDDSFLGKVDQSLLERFLRRGVDQEHFACQYVYATRYLNAEAGFPKNLELAKKYYVQSAAQGYLRAQRGLAFFYRQRGITNVCDAEKMLCWSALADQHRAGESFSSGVDAVEQAARSESSPVRDPRIKEQLESLRREWAPIGGEIISKKPSTASQCLSLENKAN